METQKIEIPVPEGHEVRQSQKGNIITIELVPVLPKKKQLWEYVNQYFTKLGWVINCSNDARKFDNRATSNGFYFMTSDKQVIANIENGNFRFADCCGILKLICDELNVRWKPTWSNSGEKKYTLYYYGSTKTYEGTFNNSVIECPFYLESMELVQEVIHICGTEFLDVIFKK